MMEVRRYGLAGPLVILIHGGPGAPGYMRPLADALADSHRVLEPFQRPSGGAPLTVGVHVEDLHELILSNPTDPYPALVGHSWGAMLALAYAAAHPDHAGPLVLIGSGTWDQESRAVFQKNLQERPPRDPDHIESAGFDRRANEETWADMVRLQQEGVYPAAFAAVRGPVLMLHGADDPHPGRMILNSLGRYMPQIEYREWERCGHHPWREAEVRDEFLGVLRDWLSRQQLQPGAADTRSAGLPPGSRR
jgi:pimeloyl-ACP methyl ester carboxylesterase